MSKQPRILKHQPDRAPVRRDENMPGAVGPDRVAHRDAALIGAVETGNQAQQACLAAAAGAEHGGNAGEGNFRLDIEVETTAPGAQPQGEQIIRHGYGTGD